MAARVSTIPGMKRWAKRIGIGLGSLAVLVVLSGASVEAVTRWRTVRRYPAPGRLVDIGGRRLHLDCRGAGAPTVVLEAGLDYLGSLSWSAVHDSLARTTRVCAYSRAGVMWSDPAPGAFDVDRNARDLHAALTNAGERAPLVMVGHSMGGPYVLRFTKLYGADVRGLVLVDASHPEQFARFKDATGKTLQPATGLLAVGSTLAWTGLAQLAPLGGKPATWPAVAVKVPNAFFPRSIGALYEETKAIDATIAAERDAERLDARPLVVLTAGTGASAEALAQMGITPEQEARRRTAWLALQDEEATWSRNSRHQVVSDASHYIQFDRPDVVIRAVREVVARVRDGGAVSRS